MYAAAALGRERWVTQRHAPAVVTDDTQACELGRRVDRRSFSRIYIGGFLPRRLVVARAFASEPTITNSANAGCSPTVLNTLADQNICQCASDLPHLHHRLSSSAAFAGFKTSEALNGRVPNFVGAFHKNEGELPNVCG